MTEFKFGYVYAAEAGFNTLTYVNALNGFRLDFISINPAYPQYRRTIIYNDGTISTSSIIDDVAAVGVYVVMQ